jgi:hypothetical protein
MALYLCSFNIPIYLRAKLEERPTAMRRRLHYCYYYFFSTHLANLFNFIFLCPPPRFAVYDYSKNRSHLKEAYLTINARMLTCICNTFARVHVHVEILKSMYELSRTHVTYCNINFSGLIKFHP